MRKWVNTKVTDIREYYILPRRIALAYSLTAFIFLLALWLFIGDQVEEQFLREERTQVASQVNTIGTSLTLAVNQRLMIITSVHSFVEAKISQHDKFDVDISQGFKDFDEFVSGLYTSTPGIRNIAIAPGSVMEFVFPYEENKSVLGYNPAQDERPNVREEVQRAIQTADIVISLPNELIQGGEGIIARQAIFENDSYWGLANVVLDVSPLLEESGIDPMPAELDLAVLDQSGKLFFGSANVIVSDPVSYEIKLPDGAWVLAAVPKAGWGVKYASIMWIYNGLGFIVTVTISLLVYLSINHRERLAHTVDLRTRELKQSNQTLINVLEGIDADVYVADFETFEILFANKHLQESFQDELMGKICYEVFRHEADICAHCMNSMLLQSTGEPSGVLIWEDFNPITRRWYSNSDRAIRWRDGRYVHLQIAMDITAQKMAVDALRESEEQYRNLFNSVPVGIYHSTPDGRFLDGNPALMKILGYPDRETMLAANIRDLFIDESVRERELTLIEKDQFISDYVMQLRRSDGAVIWVQDSANAVRDNSGEITHYYGRLENITERIQAELALQESERRFREVLESVQLIAISTSRAGYVTFCNEYLLDLIGWTREELLGKNWFETCLPPDVGPAVQKMFNESLEKENLPSYYENEIRSKAGERRLIVWNNTLLRNIDGQVIGASSIGEDVTERKLAEKKMKDLLREKDVLLAEVHHRVKNNMQVIISLLGLQADEIEDEKLKEVYEESRNRIKSMTLVHEQLYRSNEYARIDFGTYIDQLATSLFNTYQIDPDQIQLKINADGIYIDLERAIPCGLLINELITNSLKYAFSHGKKGQIWITLKEDADKIYISFGDNGVGLPADLDIEKTQSLGLQLVRLLTVHDLHGEITLENGFKTGAHFLINFPLSEIEIDGVHSL